MGIMLLLLVFVLARIRISSPQQTSSEDINNILDKLIHQTNNDTSPNVNGETPDNPEPYYPIPMNPEAEAAGNDSNIYYFKTYMAPRIKFKSNSETLHVLHRSNKTVHSRQVGRTYEAMSEDELIPGTPKNGNIDNEEQGKLRIGPNNYFSEKETNPINQYGRSGDEVDKNFNMLEDLFQKQILNKPTSEKSPYAHIPPQPLSLLHDYPEIVIDHISYNNDPKDDGVQTQITSIKSTQDLPSVTVKETFDTPFNPTPKTIYEPVTLRDIELPIDKYPDFQDIVDSIKQSKDFQNNPVTKAPEDESKKQSSLLEKILQKLPDKSSQDVLPVLESRAALPYPISLDALPSNDMNVDGISLLSGYLQNLQRNIISRRLSTTYLHSPVLTQNWAARRPVVRVPYLTGLVRPEARRTRVVTAFRRVMPRYVYRSAMPVYYGLY